MSISDLIFTDGKILGCVVNGDEAAVQLIDYMNNRFDIRLAGAVVEWNAKSMGYSVQFEELKKSGDGWLLVLYDDDRERIFHAHFSSAAVFGPK